MLCETPQELLDLVRAEAPGADDVLCSDNPEAALYGFCLWYPGGSVQHSVSVKKAMEWDPPCRELKALFMRTDGRTSLAAAMKEGRPLHEGCGHCLASHVMEN